MDQTRLPELSQQCRLSGHRDIGRPRKDGKNCCEYGIGVSTKLWSEGDVDEQEVKTILEIYFQELLIHWNVSF